MALNPEQRSAIELAIQVMTSESELLDQATRMNLGDNTGMVKQLDKAIILLQEIIGK